MEQISPEIYKDKYGILRDAKGRFLPQRKSIAKEVFRKDFDDTAEKVIPELLNLDKKIPKKKASQLARQKMIEVGLREAIKKKNFKFWSTLMNKYYGKQDEESKANTNVVAIKIEIVKNGNTHQRDTSAGEEYGSTSEGL
jgi:hypothetical protein